MRTLVLLLLAPLLAGCATLFRAGAPARAVTDPEIAEAKAALNAALDARDSVAIAALFDGDGILVTPAGDTVRGGAAAAAHLLHVEPALPIMRIDFTPELRLAQCQGGGFERGRLRFVARALPEGESHPVGRYRVHWRALPRHGARIATLSFLEADSNRDLPPGACIFPERDRFHASRVSVAVYPGLIGMRGASVGGSVGDALAAQGWRDDIAICGGQCRLVAGPRTTGHDSRPPVTLVAASVRARGPLIVTASVGPGLSGETTGYINLGRKKAVLRHESMVAGLTAGATWGLLEVGIGPAVQRLDWHLGQTTFPNSTPVVQEQAQWQVGGLGRVRFSLPVWSGLALEIMGEARAFPGATTPAVGEVQSASVRTHSAALALGVRYYR